MAGLEPGDSGCVSAVKRPEKGGFVPLAPALKVAIEGYRAPGRTEEDKGVLPDSEVARAEQFGCGLGVKLSGR